jgi:hypothetical protein
MCVANVQLKALAGSADNSVSYLHINMAECLQLGEHVHSFSACSLWVYLTMLYQLHSLYNLE